MTSTTNENLSPQERIINYIRTALQTGELKPNMKLPAERKLAEQFNIGRAYVRKRMESSKPCHRVDGLSWALIALLSMV